MSGWESEHDRSTVRHGAWTEHETDQEAWHTEDSATPTPLLSPRPVFATLSSAPTSPRSKRRQAAERRFQPSKLPPQPIVLKVPDAPLITLDGVPLICSGDLALQVDGLDTANERSGFAYQVTKYALQAVGLLEDEHYQFVSLRSDAVVQHASQQPGSALRTRYIEAATGFVPTALRRHNFLFGFPLKAGRAQAQLWRLPNSTALPASPVIGIIADYALDSGDLANCKLQNYSVLYFASTELGSLQETVYSKFANASIDALLHSSQLYDQQGHAMLESCDGPFASNKFEPALLVSKSSPNAQRLLRAYNEGLRLIVQEGIYQALWEETRTTGTPWTPRNWPDLKRPKAKLDAELALLLD